MAQKKSKELFSKILLQKEANHTKNKRQANDVVHLLLHSLALHLNKEKIDVRSKAKRGGGKDPEFVFVFIVFSFLEV